MWFEVPAKNKKQAPLKHRRDPSNPKFYARWTIFNSVWKKGVVIITLKLTFEHPGTGQMLHYNEVPQSFVNQYSLSQGKVQFSGL